MIKKLLAYIICVLAVSALVSCNYTEEPAPAPAPTVSSVELDRTVLVMDKGEKIGVSAKIYPTDVTSALIWHSTNTAVVTVTDGVLKAVAPGNALVICTTPDGKYGKCNVVVNDNECVHVEGQWIIDKNPTCSTNGVKHTECTLCKQVMNVETTDRTNSHTPGAWQEIVKATCSSQGVKYRECTSCKALIDKQVIQATGNHTPDSRWIVDTPATCGQNGVQHKECTKCHSKVEIELIPMSSQHKNGEPVIENVTNQTCLEAGSYESVTYCTICHKETGRTKFATIAGDHTYTEWINISATCYNGGIEKRECQVCGKTQEREIAALGHDLVSHEGLEPTCYRDGYAAYQTCNRCEYTTYQALEQTYHSYVIEFFKFGDTVLYPSKDEPAMLIVKCKYDCEFNDTDIPETVDVPAFTDPLWIVTEIVPGTYEYSLEAVDKYGETYLIYFLLDENYNILIL